jgi:hypothetical protein
MDDIPPLTKKIVIMGIIRWVVLMLAFGILIAALSGCGQRITSGEVTYKEFVPEHEIEVDDPDITVGDITIPGGSHMETVPDSWFITIEKDCEDGEHRSRVIRVEKGLHDSLKEGDWYNLPEN